jgi:hypothetical protein
MNQEEKIHNYLNQTKKNDDFVHYLVREYVLSCELNDRTICTGPIKFGSVIALGDREKTLSNLHSAKALKRLYERSDRALIPRELIKQARQQYDGSNEYRHDLDNLLYP